MPYDPSDDMPVAQRLLTAGWEPELVGHCQAAYDANSSARLTSGGVSVRAQEMAEMHGQDHSSLNGDSVRDGGNRHREVEAKRRRAAESSESDSSGSSSSSESSSERRERRRREKKKEKRRGRDKEKKEKRRKDKHHKHKKKKDSKSEPHDVQRSVVTGKRLRRSEGERADAEGEARRARMREQLNGDELESLTKPPPPARSELEELQERARFDPALMKELMEKGHEAQRAKAAKRGKAPESAARRQYYANLLSESRDEGRR